MRKEFQILKNELVPESRSIDVLLQTKAKDMTDSEIDKLVQEVPINRIPTDVLEAVLNRELGKINNILGTDYKHVSDISSEHLQIIAELKENEPAEIET